MLNMAGIHTFNKISYIFVILAFSVAKTLATQCLDYSEYDNYKYCYYYCCGSATSRYCCDTYYYYYAAALTWSIGAIVGAVIGGIIGLVVLAVIIVCICQACNKTSSKGTVVRPQPQPQPTVTVVSSGYQQPPPVQPYGYSQPYGQPPPPMQYNNPSSAYPPPPPYQPQPVLPSQPGVFEKEAAAASSSNPGPPQ